MKSNWKLLKRDKETTRRIRDLLNFPDLLAKVLVNRGIDKPHLAMNYVYPKTSNLPSPFLFRDMKKALDRIVEAVEKKQGILVFGDKDVDGVTATSIVYKLLQKIGARVAYRVPEKMDSYGISRDVVGWAALNEFSVMITVDCGITALEEADYAASLGVDLIVTDHHEPREVLPKALAVINPKVEGDAFSFPFLSGAGVAFMLALALMEKLDSGDYYNQEIVFLDLETTGLNPNRDEIIEIGAIKVKNGVILEEFQELIRSKRPIPDEAIKIHGITNDMLKEGGKDLGEVLDAFLKFIGDRKLVGHNLVNFDLKFLNFSLKREKGIKLTNPVEDTLKLAKVSLSHLKKHNLNTVAQYLGYYVDTSTLHRSVADSEVCAEVYRRIVLGRSPRYQQILKELMPLAALGTIADIMPLIDLNRNIVKNGLKLMGQTSVGVLSLIRAAKIDVQTLTSKKVSWNISPLLNSPGRMGDAALSVELLVSNKVSEAEDLAKQIFKKDNERKLAVQNNQGVADKILKDHYNPDEKMIFVYSEEITRGTTGLIANRLAGTYQVPAVIMSVDGDFATGSIRTSGGFHVVHMLEHHSDLFEQFGGHKAAGGFTIQLDRVDEFKQALIHYMESVDETDLVEEIVIDGILEDLSDLDHNTMRYMEHVLEPLGRNNEFPNFLVQKVMIKAFKVIGKKNDHCIFQIEKGGVRLSVIAWGMAAEMKDLMDQNTYFDLVGRPEINRYQGNEEVRLSLVDVEGKG